MGFSFQMAQPPPFGYRPEDIDPDTENPNWDVELNRERLRKSRNAANRIEVASYVIIFGGLVVYIVAGFFVSPARLEPLWRYAKIVAAFVLGLALGAEFVAPLR